VPYQSPSPDPREGTTTLVPLATTTIAARPEQLPKLRRWLRELLDGRYPRADDVELCLSEVVTNSLVHTGSPEIMITVSVSGRTTPPTLRVDVTDSGVRGNRPHVCGAAGTDHERGRGILLVDAVTGGRWGTAMSAESVQVTWFEVPSSAE
jgi:anti-sigma regulatory factor (Ser/Thr protein kinase)